MENDQRPRFNQETGERIIYDDDIGASQLESVQTEIPTQQMPPAQQAPPQTAVQQKSGCGGCLKGCLITLVICLILVGLLAAGGYAFYKISQPDEVEFEQADVESFYNKIGVDNKNYEPSIEEIFAGKAVPSGELKVDYSFTSAEITAVIQDASKRNDVFKDVNVRFIGENKVEVFATVSDNVDNIYEIVPDLKNYDFVMERIKGLKLYYVGDVVYNPESGFDLNVDKLKVGLFIVPTSMVNEYDSVVESLFNKTVDNMDGLTIEAMTIDEDGLDFIGTIPEKL